MPGFSCFRSIAGFRPATLIILLLFACGGDSTGPDDSPGPGPGPGGGSGTGARVIITPGALLLTAAGESMQLTARVFDISGQPVQATVTWQSSDPGTVSVSSSGLATAAAGLGSAQITAMAQGVTSQPALALVARPAAGVVLIADSLILTDPLAVDAAADYGPGWQYRIRIRGPVPQTGQLVIGTGGRALAGRVLGATDQRLEAELLVELVPLNQLFADLRIDETIPLVEMAPGTGGSNLRAPTMPGVRTATDFTLGRFTCSSSGEVPNLDLPNPTLAIRPSLSLALGYSNGLEKYAVVGRVTADFGYKPVFKAVFEGRTSCETVLKTVTLPLGLGPLALFFGIQVPVGVGFELEGKLEIAEVGFDVSAHAEATAELGLLCPVAGGSCAGITSFEIPQPEFEFEFIAPAPDEQFKATLGAKGFIFARPSVGTAFSASTQFSFLEATAGLKQSIDLTTATRQVTETDYASGFALQSLIDVGPGKDLQSAIEKLENLLGTDLDVDLTLVAIADTLAESPKGTFSITPSSVAPGNDEALGDMVTFTVDLDPITYLGIESVEKVEFFWKKDNANGDFTLEPGRPACTTLTASAGLTKFECETDFLEEHAGEQTFYAFVHAKLFGIPLPIPLEVSNDGKNILTVVVDNPVEVLESHFAGNAFAAAGALESDAEEEAEFTNFLWSGSAQRSWPYSTASAQGSFQVEAVKLPDGIRITAAGSGSGTVSGTSDFGDAGVSGVVTLTFRVVAPLVRLTLTGEALGPEGGCNGDRDCDSGELRLRNGDAMIINQPPGTPPGPFEYSLLLTPGEYLVESFNRLKVSTTGEVDANGVLQKVTRSQTAGHGFTLTLEAEEQP